MLRSLRSVVHGSLLAAVLAFSACADEVAVGGDAEVTGGDAELGPETGSEVEVETSGEDDLAPSETAAEVEAGSETGPGPLPLPGFGVITGDCGFVAGELGVPGPSLFVNHYDFGSDPYDAGDLAKLTDGGRKILDDGNAGGSSILSEVFAFEMLARCDGAVLLKTENEIVYDVAAKITDMVVEIDGKKVGANPTRAVGFPFEAPYTVEQAKTILEKKLGDIKSSSETVSAGDRWVKQILTVFAYSDDHIEPVETAWNAIDPALRGDTIVIVTVTDGDDRFIYSNN